MLLVADTFSSWFNKDLVNALNLSAILFLPSMSYLLKWASCLGISKATFGFPSILDLIVGKADKGFNSSSLSKKSVDTSKVWDPFRASKETVIAYLPPNEVLWYTWLILYFLVSILNHSMICCSVGGYLL